MKISKLVKAYNRYYMSKSSIIFIAISIIILTIYSFYSLFVTINDYSYSFKLYNKNYYENSFNLLKLIIIFILSLVYLKESNLTESSFNVVFESICGRDKVFLSKQLSIISSSFIIVSSYYFVLFIPSYYMYNLFKFDFFKDYLYILVFTFEVIEVCLVVNYLFKNYIVTSLITLLFLINSFLDNKYINYIIPIYKASEMKLDYNIIYAIFYISICLLINYYLYIIKDRK